MATRFYLNTGHAAALSLTRPLPGGFAWEQNVPSLPTTRRIGKTALGTANNASAPYGQLVSNLGTGANNCDILFFQGLSDPLAAQTISGTVQGVAVVREGNTSDNLYTQLAVYVVDKTGTRVATLFNGSTTGGTEWNSPSANTRNIPRQGSAAITSYTCAAGDRIVIEIGCRTQSTRTTVGAYMYLGDPGGSDLPTGDGGSNNTTINPWVELSADLQFGNAGSFSLDAFLKGEREAAFSLDAFIFDGVRYFGLDAVVQRTGTPGSLSLDGITQVIQAGSFSLDAVIPLRVTSSFSLDAVLQDTPALIIDDPFDDAGSVSGEWTANWTLIRGIEGTTTEHGRNPTKGAFIYDDTNTVLDSERGGYIHRRTFLKKQITVRARIAQVSGSTVVGAIRYAAYLRHSGETSGLGYYDADYIAAELLLQPGGSLALQIRSDYQTVLYGPVDLTSELGTWSVGDELYIKGWVKGSRVKGKVWRVGDPEPRWQINQIGLPIPSGAGYIGMAANTRTSWKPVEWNVRRAFAYNLDFSVDLDAVLKATMIGSAALDAVTRAEQSGSFGLDAVISLGSVPGTGAFSLDAVLGEGFESSFPIAAITRAARGGTFGLSGAVLKTRLDSFTADALISVPRSGSFTLDGWKLAGRSGALSIDAIVRAGRAGSHALDAITQAPQAGSFPLAAAIVVRTVVAAPLDAVLKAGQAGSFGLDADVGRTSEWSFSADSVIKRVSGSVTELDSVIKAELAWQMPVDSVIQRTQASSFSLAAVKGLAFLEPVGGVVVIDMLEAAWSIRMLGYADGSRFLEATTWIEYPLAAQVTIEEVEYADG